MLYLSPRTALIVVDVQNDFCPGGALPVRDGDRIVPVLNDYLERLRVCNGPVIATRDWHPPNHCSFHDHGGVWPPHCVQGQPGAAFHPGLKLPEQTLIISKGVDPARDDYSGFANPALERNLRLLGVEVLLIGGLATDYCVKSTVLDARRRGFETVFLQDACRAVNKNPGDGDTALTEMLAAGAQRADLSMISG